MSEEFWSYSSPLRIALRKSLVLYKLNQLFISLVSDSGFSFDTIIKLLVKECHSKRQVSFSFSCFDFTLEMESYLKEHLDCSRKMLKRLTISLFIAMEIYSQVLIHKFDWHLLMNSSSDQKWICFHCFSTYVQALLELLIKAFAMKRLFKSNVIPLHSV